MLIAQISDAHVGVPGTLFYNRFDTAGALRRAVEELNLLDPRPDVVLFTGDLGDKGTPEEYVFIRELLAALEIPLFVIPGNHDNRAAMLAAFGDVPYLDGADEFFHYAVDDHPVRLVGLDTVNPSEFGAGEMCGARLDWLDRTLGAQPDRPTVIFMHHPPFDTGIVHMDRIKCANGKAFAEIVARHPQVERVLCGHVHRPVQIRLGGTIAQIAPSIAHQVPLDLRPDGPPAFVFEPAAFMLHHWQADRGIVSHMHYIGDFGSPISFSTGEPVA
ncbi:phosphodiesterase [Chelativorans sp. ZYF759]|uniref:phosphodiesterase n=1 Tax=Chelativorans sp. ZYF759 TaxID=2692213 RepID=UPI00145F5E27|nr:phosphodiesterase [Chelativorans sp. ZYF759]NMG37663.1 phosphodiesterase [Chelativorans sp. ZYF759]